MSAVLTLLKPHQRDVGGFTVHRLLPNLAHRTIGPFIFSAPMGPVCFSAGSGLDMRPHPHIELATVTYLFDGRTATSRLARLGSAH